MQFLEDQIILWITTRDMVENDPLYFDTFFISSLLVITKWYSAVDNFFFGKSKPGKLDFLINEKQRQKLCL